MPFLTTAVLSIDVITCCLHTPITGEERGPEETSAPSDPRMGAEQREESEVPGSEPPDPTHSTLLLQALKRRLAATSESGWLIPHFKVSLRGNGSAPAGTIPGEGCQSPMFLLQQTTPSIYLKVLNLYLPCPN